MRRHSTFLLWTLLLLVIWALWLCRLDARDLSFDEVATWYITRRPLMEIFQYLRQAIYEHPPVYYTFMHFWIRITGTGEFTLRLFSVMTALIALPLTGWVARLISDSPRRGLIPATLLAAMPGFAYYARNARMYTLNVVWVLLSSGLFFRDWLHTRSWPGWRAILLLASVHLLALFTHYYFLLSLPVQLMVLLIARRWRSLLAWSGLHGGLALAGMIWLTVAPGLQDSTRGFRFFPQIPSLLDLAHLLRLLIFSQTVRIPFPGLYAVLLMGGAGILVLIGRKRWTATLWLTCALVLPVVLAYQLPRQPTERYILLWLPFLALALGALVGAPYRLPYGIVRGVGIPLLALGLGGYLAWNGFANVLRERGGYGHVLLQVRACARPGDGILFYGPWQWLPFQYYDPGGLPPITTLPPSAPPRLSLEEAQPVLEDLLSRYHRLWVLPAAVDDVDPPHLAEGWLNTHAHPVWRTTDFTLYLPALPPNVPTRTLQVTFGEALRLEQVTWESEETLPGEPVRFTLYWLPLREFSGDVRVSMRLKDAQGNIWSEAHVIPREWADPPSRWRVGEVIPDDQGLMVPPGAPPGEYTLWITVADEQTREPLLAGGQAEIPLFSLTVREPPAESISEATGCWLPSSTTVTFCSSDGSSCIDLVGYGGPRDVYPGYPIPLTFHWKAPDRPVFLSPTIRVSVTPLLTSICRASPSTISIPIIPDYPASEWPPGRLITQMSQVPIPPETPAGLAWLRLEVIGPDGKTWETADGKTQVSIGQLVIHSRPARRFLPLLGIRRIRVAFGDAVELRGYRIEGEARPGGTLHLTYFWYARARPLAVYAVFNHLLTQGGELVAQVDGWPREGHFLTTQWLPGDYVEDHYTLAIPADAPPGPYRLFVGMYDAATGERLPAIRDGQRLPEDRLFLPLPGESHATP